jgi:outer membrane protein assembly factor BamA
MDSVPLIVQVTDSPPFRARAGVGYGTSDCVRSTGGFTIRNFLGHARLLDVAAGDTIYGNGARLDWGLERGI